MPEISQNAIAATNGTGNAIEFTSASNTCTAKVTNNLSNRNLFINGEALINQRNATGQPVGGYAYGVDRWRGFNDGTARYDLTQETITDLPGFSKAYKITVTTAQAAYSGTTISVPIETCLEGSDIAHLNFGTANAKNITISFWVKSSVTGSFACAVFNGNSIDRVVVKDFTISTNDWEKKSITFSGDTGGTWKTDNTQGLYVALASAGSDSDRAVTTAGTWQGGGYKNRTTSSANLFATNGATMFYTGLQLEASDYSTDFEHLSYETELARCQRYHQKIDFYKYTGYTTTYSYWCDTVQLRPSMRATPTLDKTTDINVDTGTGSFKISNGTVATDGAVIDRASTECVIFKQNQGYNWSWNTIRMHFSAEL